MSTEIAEIKGRTEHSLSLTRFYGGKDNGAMLQITITPLSNVYIQLTKEHVNEFIQVLNDCFDYDKYPSE